eukprot:699739_1
MSTSFELEPVWAYHAMETLLDSDMRWCVYQNEGMPRRIKRIEDGAFVDKTALMVELNYLDKHGNCTNYHGIWVGSGQYLASSFRRLLHLPNLFDDLFDNGRPQLKLQTGFFF